MDKLTNTIAMMEQDEMDPMMEAPVEGVTPSEGPMFEDNGLDEDAQTQAIEDHLDTLPDDDKEFLAGHLSKEMAMIIGLISGSQMLQQYFESIANPDIALIPVPREKAKEMLAHYQGMQQEATQPPTAPQAQAPQGPMPQGVMGQPVM
jgi:hypothetical protein